LVESRESRSNRQREQSSEKERAEAIVRERVEAIAREREIVKTIVKREQKQSSERATVRELKQPTRAIVRSNRHIGSQDYMCRWSVRMSHMNY
jgi:hypothetical protein